VRPRSRGPGLGGTLPFVLALADVAGCGRGAEHPRPPLRVGLYSGPVTRDPHLVREYITYGVLSSVYEGLVDLDRALVPRPRLAESWESPDRLTWRFHVRRGVRFQDGRPLDARDVAFSLERVRRLPTSEYGGYLAPVDSVRALDSDTVEIRTREPAGTLLQKLAIILIVPRDSPPEIVDPIGSGPYRLAPNAEGFSLRAYPGYWGPPPPEPEIRLVVVPDAAEARKRLLSGGLDLLWRVAPPDAALVDGVNGCRVVGIPSFAVEVLQMRVSAPPFSDARVRRAIQLALDRQDLVHAIGDGRGLPANQLVGRGVLGFAPDLPLLAFDVDGARRLLAEAGVPPGFEVEMEFREGRNGVPIQSQLAAAGLRVRLRPRPWKEMIDRLVAGQVSFYYGAYAADTGDAGDILRTLLASPASGGGGARIGYSSPELDRLLGAADHAPEVRERRAMLEKAMALAMSDLPVVPLIIPEDLYGLGPGVEWTPRPDGRFDARELRRRRPGRP